MTPDVNVLVAASRSDHPYHVPALRYLEAALAEAGPGKPFAVLPMVASGFLRLVTHPKVFHEPTPWQAAIDFLRSILESPGVSLTPLGSEWPLFVDLCEKHQLAGNSIPDAWIAAAAQHQQLQLVTFDRDFRRLMKASRLVLLER